jgi:ABC-type branched-subunit amino acid transport system ATPase component
MVYGRGAAAVHALRAVDLVIGHGEFVVVLGPSGSGKTTLLNVIGGIEPPTSGRVVVAGEDVSRLRSDRRTAYRRAVEMGSLRAAGMGARMLARLVAAENLLLTVAELVPGLAAGSLLATGFMAAYQNDQMRLSLRLQPATVPMIAVTVLAAAAAAQWLALGQVGRTDIARIVRERST